MKEITFVPGDISFPGRARLSSRLKWSTFLFNGPRLLKEHCSWKVLRLCPFVLLVTETRRCREDRNNGEIILTKKIRNIGEKPVPVPLCPPQI